MSNLPIAVTATCFLLISASQSKSKVTLQIREGRPVADGVYINGQGPYRFLVDTGATLNHLDPKVGERIGLKPTFYTNLKSSTGVSAASGSSGIELSLDSARADNQAFLLAGLDAIQQTWPDIKGILGQEFLSRFDYLLDMRAGTLEFGRRGGSGNGTRTVFKTDRGRPVILSNIGWLVLDSGTDRLIRFGLKASEPNLQMKTVTGMVKLGTVFSTFTIAGHNFWRGYAIAIGSPAEGVVDGLLPASIFHSVYVSNSERYIVFE